VDLRRRALYVFLPALLCLAYALGSFWPRRDGMPGFGEDPLFNAWHFLHLFRTFDAHGPLAAFSQAAWDAPIFAPGHDRLALSENQLWPALALYPIWKLTGQLVPTLTAGLVLLTCAAFFAAAAWLRGRGIEELACWGGLFFACCGWVQCHYAHYQNACIFVLPLALFAWDRLLDAPSLVRGFLAGAAFGWISGWNVYFFLLFVPLCGGLVLRSLLRRRLGLLQAAAVLAGAAAACAPVLPHYAAVAREVGSFAAWDAYPAAFSSVLARPGRPSLLEATLRFWPRAGPGIEAAGFVGFTWLAVSAASLLRPRLWWPLLLAGLAFWASLGPGHGLYDLLRGLPGYSGLRAIGRLQIGFTLGTLLCLLSLLEEAKGAMRWLPLAAILLELLPAGAAQRVRIPAALDGPPTPLEQALAGDSSPVLVLGEVQPRLQLAVLRSGAALAQGYSGRATAGGDLLFDRLVRKQTPALEVLQLTQARRVLASGPRALELRTLAQTVPAVRETGCHDALGEGICLFAVAPLPGEGAPRIVLGRDTEERNAPLDRGVALELAARAPGLLDYASLAACHAERVLEFPLGLTLRHDLGLEGRSFLRLEAGQPFEVIYRKEIRGPWHGWPALVRPRVSARLVCGEEEAER
jgi:hypothetical protein